MEFDREDIFYFSAFRLRGGSLLELCRLQITNGAQNDDLQNDDLQNDDLQNDDLQNDDLRNDDLKNLPEITYT